MHGGAPLSSGRPVRRRRLSCPSVQADTRLTPGQPAPEFSLSSDQGSTVSLSDFRDNRATFNDADVTVLGISPDKPEKLAKFRDKEGLTFPLLSDPDRSVLQAWGAWGEKTMYGKTTTGVIRSTFLVDADGTIAEAQYGV